MSLAEIGAALAELHNSVGFRARRFDNGAEFQGRVAVLPSAFNPPTRAHLRLLEAAAGVEGIAHTAALLTTNNVDKQLFGAPLAHRVGMLKAVQRERPRMAVVASNAARLIDQGQALRARWPEVEFDFVVGFDTLIRVFDARYYEDMADALERFFGSHRLIATNRAQASIDAVRDYLRSEPARGYADRIVAIEIDDAHAHVSSTQAREAVVAGSEVGALTPEIASYIRKHGLYGE